MGLLNSYTGNDNFWVTNPQLLLSDKLKKLYDGDKSKDKVESSKIMYAVCFLIDPSEENRIFRAMLWDDRKSEIAKSYLRNPDFNWDLYTDIIAVCEELILSPIEKSLMYFYKKLQERDKFINDRPYDEVNYEMLDKLLSNTNKFWDYYRGLQKELLKETDKINKGGKTSSLSDSGKI
jgi:hypothetical protein